MDKLIYKEQNFDYSECRIELNGYGIIYIEREAGDIITTVANNKTVNDLKVNVHIVLPDYYSYSNSDFVIDECIKKAEKEIKTIFGNYEKETSKLSYEKEASNKIDEDTFRSLITKRK